MSASARGTGGVRIAAMLVALGVLVAGLAVGSPGSAAPANRVEVTDPTAAFAETRTIRRAHLGPDGTEQVVGENTVTVTADHTTELRGRERIRIAWSGARPSGGRAANPYGENGLAQEYPVVVLQCRGVDDPAAPAARRVSPETCWTSTWSQRSAIVTHRNAVWRHDRYATEADRDVRSGAEPFPAEQCVVPGETTFSARATPFRAAGGEEFPGCHASRMPPEAAAGASFPPAEVAAFTNADGEGEINFEVRSAVENASLGCSRTVACSVVVIPIMGISCEGTDVECRRSGNFPQGSDNFTGTEVHGAVSPKYWWAPSNWRNRFTVPLTFALPPDACDVLDPRAPVGFYGSELLSQAALQWSPAYCLNEERFKFQHNRMPDEGAFTLMSRGGAAAALVSGEHEPRGEDPVGYAPTAVTGFAVSYVIDQQDNAGEYVGLRLNARLLAKLLTQSYPASDLGRRRPGIEGNPTSMNQDPEFVALNPGLDDQSREAAATVLSLAESSDVVGAITEYIAADPAAREFVAGRPDPWGMRVNPSYEDIALPTRLWPMLDDYKPRVNAGTCRHENNDTPYLAQVAAPVTSLRTIADALIDAWPNLQTRCEGPFTAPPLFRTGRVERQVYGKRFMLGIVSLGDAARFGLRTAALHTSADRYVGPTAAAIGRGVALAQQEDQAKDRKKSRKKGQQDRFGPFVLDQAAVRRDGRAYPGTMIVYTAARLSGMDTADARTVASFIRIATSEGQRSGRGNGQLPEGYLPILRSGPTAKLYDAARKVAAAVAAQRPAGPSDPADDDADEAGEGSGKPSDLPSSAGSGGPPGGRDAVVPLAAPAPGTAPTTGAAPTASPVSSGAVETAATRVERSALGGLLLPLLLGLGILGGVVTAALRTATGVRGRTR